MRYQPINRTLSADLIRRLSNRERLSLGQDVCDQNVMVTANWIQGPVERYEIARNDLRALVNQLIKRVLPVSTRLAEVDCARFIRYGRTVEHDPFPVAFHGQLLQISGESFQILFVRQNGDRMGTEEVVVPDRKQAHEHGQIAIKGSSAEVLVK